MAPGGLRKSRTARFDVSPELPIPAEPAGAATRSRAAIHFLQLAATMKRASWLAAIFQIPDGGEMPSEILWILDYNGEPAREPDASKWADWFFTADRVVKRSALWGGWIVVATIFLGIDHDRRSATPILWETKVFGGPWDGVFGRSRSKDEALQVHRQMVRMYRGWSLVEGLFRGLRALPGMSRAAHQKERR